MLPGNTRRTTLISAGAAIAAASLALALAAAALAAHPKKGHKYSGFVSASAINGFKPPVTFKVSSDGTKLLNFTYSSLGCEGAGGFMPGVDYWTKPFAIKKVGTVKVAAASGRFSVKNAKSTFVVSNQKTVTTTSVSGSFKNAKTATGTITFSQAISVNGGLKCGPAKLTFSAKAH
jgi:hypothetical protein